jgi:hypothetical protein
MTFRTSLLKQLVHSELMFLIEDLSEEIDDFLEATILTDFLKNELNG